MTSLLEHPRVAELAQEKSVRGEVARLALEKAAEADAEQRKMIERALQELLPHFDVPEANPV